MSKWTYGPGAPPSTAGTSGDIIADRRYAWAEAAAADGDHAAAADLFAQTLELTPDWAAAWFALGEAREKIDDGPGAVEAFARAAALDTHDALGARLRLAVHGAQNAPLAASPAYIRALFDQYAGRFETHLVETLRYRGPQLLRAGLEHACTLTGRAFWFRNALDLGCGTGLMAKALQPLVSAFAGVDLSPKMVAAARMTGCYRRVEAGELVEFLGGEPDASADLAVAADVLVYIGDLRGVFAQCARVLEPGGLFGFTVQQGEALWALGPDLRYAHAPGYLRGLAAQHGFETLSMEAAPTRQDAGRDVPGLVCVLARA